MVDGQQNKNLNRFGVVLNKKKMKKTKTKQTFTKYSQTRIDSEKKLKMKNIFARFK